MTTCQIMISTVSKYTVLGCSIDSLNVIVPEIANNDI